MDRAGYGTLMRCFEDSSGFFWPKLYRTTDLFGYISLTVYGCSLTFSDRFAGEAVHGQKRLRFLNDKISNGDGSTIKCIEQNFQNEGAGCLKCDYSHLKKSTLQSLEVVSTLY